MVTVGLLNANQVYPLEIFSDAIAKRAASIILLEIKIHDCTIVLKDWCTSIRKNGLIQGARIYIFIKIIA